MRFGLDADSLGVQQALGIQADYSSIWIGVWNLEKGWREPDRQLTEMREANVTPAVHFYYWGDDLSIACLERGCNGKNQEGWNRLAQELGEHLTAQAGGGPVLVVLETEFNKASVARYEPLDGLLATKAMELKQAYPAAQVVLGLGSWNSAAWTTWDRAAAASDAVGIQAMVGSTTGTSDGPGDLFNETLAGVRVLTNLFQKPVVLQDVAIPSGPGPANEHTQATALGSFMDGLPDLKAAGVQAILYRSYLDRADPSADGYFGEAERYFGLSSDESGAPKPAGELWIAAMDFEGRGAGRATGGPK